MNYDVIALACEQLSYRDKLRLAQLLIQTARKEEEETNPESRSNTQPIKDVSKHNKKEKEGNVDDIEYIMERLNKLKPTKKKSIENSIKAMFQFQGGISDTDVSNIINELQKKNYISIKNNKVIYI